MPATTDPIATAAPSRLRTRLLGAALLLLSAPLAACGDDAGSENAADDTSSSAAGSSSAAPQGSGEGVACEYSPDGSGGSAKLPPASAAYAGPVQATIGTTAGDLKVTLDGKGAPCTVNSFLSLAKQGYFDDTPCHRLTSYSTLSVLQCGDPTGQGTGGPGYTIPDELDTAGDYAAGVLAMANTGAPDSGGSQFFIVYADSQLPPSYTIFGRIDEAGVKAVAKVAADGSTPAEDGAPNTAVKITKVTQP